MADLQRLWAPWRSTFLSQGKPRRCFFCAAWASRDDRATHVIARSTTVFALLNRYPYNNGHVLVAPARHIGEFGGLASGEWSGMLRLSQELTRRLRRRLRAQGFNLGMNLGRLAGAGVPGHLHLHIVPRWGGDTNFMPIVGQTKVISQSLEELYQVLADRTARRAPRR